MATDLESLGLDRLSRDDQLRLVGQLWDRIVAAEPPGSFLTEAQRQELRRRVEDAEAHPDQYVSWEHALAATLKRLSN